MREPSTGEREGLAPRKKEPSAGEREGLAPRKKSGRPRQAPSAERFQAERQALRKIQVHFEFQQSLMRKIRLAAAAENLSYSDYVRKLVGLPYAKIQRPRISLSFGERDLELLAARYAEEGAGPGELKRRVMEEIEAYFETAD